MGTLSSAQAIYGLNATGTPSAPNTSGTIILGEQQSRVPLTTVTNGYSISCILATGSDSMPLVVETGVTTGSTAWVDGQPQIETATAAGTITLAGNATITVTAAGMSGSTKAISVAVALNDSAAVWADKVRVALAADASVSSLFSVSGASTSIILTRKTTADAIDGINFYAANDMTLNVAIDNGTCTGITPAASSSNTQAGILTSGAYITGSGKDWEGNPISLGGVAGMLLRGITRTVKATVGDYAYFVGDSQTLLFVSEDTGTDLAGIPELFEAESDPCKFEITILGRE